jgi:hypothetical protein
MNAGKIATCPSFAEALSALYGCRRAGGQLLLLLL